MIPWDCSVVPLEDIQQRSLLMAPQQHVGKKRACFVQIRQIVKRICELAKEFTEKNYKIKEEKIGNKLWTLSS